MIKEEENFCALTAHDQNFSGKCKMWSLSNKEPNLSALARRIHVTCSPEPEPEFDNTTAVKSNTQGTKEGTAHRKASTGGIEHGHLDCRRGVLRRLCSARRWRDASEAVVGGS